MPTFTFYDNIPQTTDDPSVSQAQLLQNNQTLALWAAVNHFAYGTGNDGYHQLLDFPNASSVPTPTGTQGSVYPVLDTNSALQLNWKNKDGTYPLTALAVDQGSSAG